MTFQDLKEIADSYYTVSVEIEHRCFYTYNGIDDFIKAPIGFAENKKDFVKNKKVQIGFVENKNNEFYPLVNSNDYSVYTEYIGCVKHDNNNIKLYFKISHNANLNGVNKEKFYYLLCKQCYVENISEIIKDINLNY
ncbi:MAG TPA: hypothetical protein H9923_03025 [Candidatus Dwaynia gallinarum]|nr:hypothetical protein [Candidatus Dwaynia gallinarum]